MPRGHSLSIYARFSGKNRTSLYISREKAIDVCTITAAILNLLHLRSIMGFPGGTRSVFTRAFRVKRELHCIFFGKKAHYYIQTRHNDLFSPLQSFSDLAHAPWASHNTL